MKKSTNRRTLVLCKETLQQLAAHDLRAAAGGAPWSAAPTACPFTLAHTCVEG